MESTASVDSGTFAAASASVFVVVFAILFSVAFNVAFADSVVMTVLVAFIGAFTIASFDVGLVVMGFLVVIGLGFAGIIMGKGVVFLKKIRWWSRKQNVIHKYWLIYTLSFLVLGSISLYLISTPAYMLLALLWLLLPLVNAPLDWLSLGVTRGLLQSVRSGDHSSRTALSWALMDLALALVFLFLITTVLVGVTSLGNAISGKILVDIQLILDGVRKNPVAIDNWWIYFMLLSTLVPTLIHFALAGGAATLWLPRKWRLCIADGLESDAHKTQLAWVYLTFTPIIGFIVLPAALLFFLWWFVNANGAWLGTHLLDWAQWLANTAESL